MCVTGACESVKPLWKIIWHYLLKFTPMVQLFHSRHKPKKFLHINNRRQRRMFTATLFLIAKTEK